MPSEREIAGNILALVGAYKADSELVAMIGLKPDRDKLHKLISERAENQRVMETAALELATTVLTDLHRIADALEMLATSDQRRLDKGL